MFTSPSLLGGKNSVKHPVNPPNNSPDTQAWTPAALQGPSVPWDVELLPHTIPKGTCCPILQKPDYGAVSLDSGKWLGINGPNWSFPSFAVTADKSS